MEFKFLYVEDHPDSREQGLLALKSQGFENNIVAPTSIEECAKAIEENTFTGAMIDWSLTKWVGNDNSNAICIRNQSCYNGIHIAEQMVENNENIVIGMFSTYENKLMETIKGSAKLRANNNVRVIAQKRGEMDYEAEDIYDILPEFVDSCYKFFVEVQTLSPDSLELTQLASLFYSKKLLKALNKGEYLWKMEPFIWQVNVGNKLSGNKDPQSPNSHLEIYEMRINKGNLKLAEIRSGDGLFSFSTSEVMSSIDSGEERLNIIRNDKYSLLADLIVADIVCSKYLNNAVNSQKAIHYISQLNALAIFEFQKLLFKRIQSNTPFKSKEEIYSALSQFSQSGFPVVLDIYEARVDSVSEEIAIVKFQSLSPERIVRLEEEVSSAFLQQYSLTENSVFEYTIYKPKIGGGAYHIELV